MAKRDEVREQALKIATIIDLKWHYEGYPAKAEILVDGILALPDIAKGLEAIERGYNAKVDREADRKIYLQDIHYPDITYKPYVEIPEGWVKEGLAQKGGERKDGKDNLASRGGG